MACQKALDFDVPPAAGAHLSFYWTMDEGGAASKVDSTAGLAWPLTAGTLAAAGLFSNGTGLTPAVFGQHGLSLAGSNDITINQATSTGISFWFWIKVLAYGPTDGVTVTLDTSDPMHTNRFRGLFDIQSGATAAIEVGHTNDTDDVFVDTPNLTWTLGVWHMVALTYDKTAKTINIYVDGALSATIADAFTYPDLTQSDFTFKHRGDAVQNMDVTIDEFGLSTKGALTPAQVTALYNAGAGMTWPAVQTVVPYP